MYLTLYLGLLHTGTRPGTPALANSSSNNVNHVQEIKTHFFKCKCLFHISYIRNGWPHLKKDALQET